MKILFIALMAFTFQVSANDSSVPKITVQGIDPGNAVDNTEIKFYGKKVDAFFEMLPNIMTVGSPDEQQKLNASYRYLNIESNGWAVSLSCSKVDDNGNPQATECSIHLNKKEGDVDYGDSYEWAPSCSAIN